jgi:hypothetical protein
MNIKLAHAFSLLVAVGVASGFAGETIAPDLKALAQGIGGSYAPKVTVRWDADVKGRAALFTTDVIWLDGINFAEGTIECNFLGKSAPRGSNFPGISFHGADDSTFECIYFRPFNFRAENPENASHAVQYISLPQWPWPKLRAEKTGQYESLIASPPDGDAWFRARIVVLGKKVSVFVNDSTTPCLEVERLTDRVDGRLGISGGNGHVANLKITPRKN